MTNADRIRNMTDERLAQFINPSDCNDCPLNIKENCVKDYGVKRCVDAILAWLREEVDG